LPSSPKLKSDAQATASLISPVGDRHISLIPRYLNPNGPRFTNALDRILYDHSLSILPNLVFLNRARSSEICAAQIYELHDADAGLRSALLVSSATHLFVQGVVSKLDFLKIRQRALRAISNAVLAKQEPDNSTQRLLTVTSAATNPWGQVGSLHCSDAYLSASLNLSATGLILGEPLHNILPLIQGTVLFVMQRHRFAEFASKRQSSSPLAVINNISSHSFTITKRMLAYFDIMSCVPCARTPYMAELYWFTDKACVEQQNMDGSGLDLTMGCFPVLFALLGRCSTFIDSRFKNVTTLDKLHAIEVSLLNDLQHWSPLPQRLPILSTSPGHDSYTFHTSDYRICVFAGNAYSLATQIFLLRSRDFDETSSQIEALVHLLSMEILQVPIESAPMTTMLWPLWVLGCESYDPATRDGTIMPIFNRLLQRQSFRNIHLALEALRTRIWRLGHGTGETALKERAVEESSSSQYPWRQSEWVKYCWVEKIQLTLA
jgi:hypothetical protein